MTIEQFDLFTARMNEAARRRHPDWLYAIVFVGVSIGFVILIAATVSTMCRVARPPCQTVTDCNQLPTKQPVARCAGKPARSMAWVAKLKGCTK